MAMPLPGDIAIQAPGDLGQAPWARWPRAGPGVAVGSHRLHGAPGAGLSCGGSWEGNDSQGDMVPSAVRGLVAVTRGSVVTSQTRGLGGRRRLPAHTSLRTRYRRHRTGGPWLPVPAPAAPQFLFLSARWRQSSEAPGAEQVRARLSAPCQARGGRRRPGASGPMAPRCCCFSWTRRRARCCRGHRGQSRWRRRPVREGGSCDPAGGRRPPCFPPTDLRQEEEGTVPGTPKPSPNGRICHLNSLETRASQ